MVSCESSPDDSRRRVDAVVKRYDEPNDILSAMLWIEFKHPTGNVKQVEAQALDVAGRCIRTNSLQFVYVMTTVGVSFRVWTVRAFDQLSDQLSLIPFNGGPADAARSQYIDANSPGAEALTRFVGTVKNFPPLRITPVIPSQAFP